MSSSTRLGRPRRFGLIPASPSRTRFLILESDGAASAPNNSAASFAHATALSGCCCFFAVAHFVVAHLVARRWRCDLPRSASSLARYASVPMRILGDGVVAAVALLLSAAATARSSFVSKRTASAIADAGAFKALQSASIDETCCSPSAQSLMIEELLIIRACSGAAQHVKRGLPDQVAQLGGLALPARRQSSAAGHARARSRGRAATRRAGAHRPAAGH